LRDEDKNNKEKQKQNIINNYYDDKIIKIIKSKKPMRSNIKYNNKNNLKNQVKNLTKSIVDSINLKQL
jgi:hypothetical protein